MRTTLVRQVAPPPAAVFVLVVDDADTPDAAALRGRAVDALRGALLKYVELEWGGCGSQDPAEWHAADLRVVIARPSAPDGSALLTSVDLPLLALRTHAFSEAAIEPLVAASAEALEDRLAAPADVYRPLRAARSALEIVTRARPPEGAAELALVDSLAGPVERVHHLLVASTRADEDTTNVSDLVPAEQAFERTYFQALVAPSVDGDAWCEIAHPAPSRLEQWAAATDSKLLAWPCNAPDVWSQLLLPVYIDCLSNCLSAPMDLDASGVASCVALVDQRDVTQCDPALGRGDPSEGATMIEHHGETLRRCEVAQLDGADLQACRSTLACEGCASGFCATEVPELSYGCDQDRRVPLRFVGGSRVDGAPRLTIICVSKSP